MQFMLVQLQVHRVLKILHAHQKAKVWMPRMASAMAMWYSNQTGELGKMFDSWYATHGMLRKMVDKGMRTGKVMHVADGSF